MPAEHPKLFTKSKFVLAFSAVFIGSALSLYREFRDTGAISVGAIVASLVALAVGTIVIIFVGRYANKPEK